MARSENFDALYEQNKQVCSWKLNLYKIDVYTKSIFIVLDEKCEFFIELQHLVGSKICDAR